MSEERQTFDPKPHLFPMSRKSRNPDGSWKNVKTDYLETKWRIVWMRTQYPEALVETRIERCETDFAVVHARVTLPNGAVGCGVGMVFRDKWERFLEKAETSAIGRALGVLGFGTQFCGDEFDEDGAIADSPVDQPQQRPPSREPMPQSAAVPHATGPGDISDPQRKAIFAIGGKLGMDEAKINEFVGVHFTGLTLSGLSKAAASVIIQRLQDLEKTNQTLEGMPAIERRRE